ncbi:MAG: hypothetical protein HFE90_04340 [Firmicutes bacterium]|nr:hypothetical protein [Bacillota bacterium]
MNINIIILLIRFIGIAAVLLGLRMNNDIIISAAAVVLAVSVVVSVYYRRKNR